MIKKNEYPDIKLPPDIIKFIKQYKQFESAYLSLSKRLYKETPEMKRILKEVSIANKIMKEQIVKMEYLKYTPPKS